MEIERLLRGVQSKRRFIGMDFIGELMTSLTSF